MSLHLTKQLKRAIQNDPSKCVLLVGAGLSVSGVRKKGKGLPDWNTLMHHMIEDLRDSENCDATTLAKLEELLEKGKHLEVARLFKLRTRSDQFATFLKSELDPPDIVPSKIHEVILKTNFRGIITTNFDSVFEHQNHRLQTLVYPQCLDDIDSFRKPGFFAKIHGCVLNTPNLAENLILTEESYVALRSNRKYHTILRSLFVMHPILMVGFSLRDPDFLGLIDDLREIFGTGMPTIYALMLDPGRKARDEWRRKGVEIIPYKDHGELIGFFEEMLQLSEQRHPLSKIIPSSPSTTESKRKEEKVEKKVEEHQVITLYDPAHIVDVFKEKLIKSKKIDLYLYTAETFAMEYYKQGSTHNNPYQYILEKHPGLKIRIIVRDPELDKKKEKWALACIDAWKKIYVKNRNCKISIGLYKHPPLLRAFIFDESEGFLSMYRWDPGEYFEFMGVEGNKLLYVNRDTEFGSWLLDLYQSRFEHDWQNSKKVVIPKAIIFNMNGVIIDNFPIYASAWGKAFLSIGIKINDRDVYLRKEENSKRIVKDILEEKGIEVSEERIKKVIEEKEMKFNDNFEIKLFPGVKKFLKELKKEGFILGLVSSGTKEKADDILFQTGLSNFFNVTIAGMSDPYLNALEEFKKFDIYVEDCIVVENSPSGIRLAKETGLECIALTTSLPRDYLTDADLIVDSIEDIKEYL